MVRRPKATESLIRRSPGKYSGAFFIEILCIDKTYIFVENNSMADYIETNCFAYLDTISDLQAKIAAINVIINNNISLIGQQILNQAGGTAIYEMDDGQVRIKVNYRSLKEITDTNTALEKMLAIYTARLNGRGTVLRDKSTFRIGWPGGSWGW